MLATWAARRRGRLAAVAATSLALTLLVGCQQAPPPASQRAGGDGGTVVVASFNFPESELLAAIYGLAIRHAGIPVRLQLGLGPRELVEPALQQGLADLVPEYLGTALTSLEPDARVDWPSAAPRNARSGRTACRGSGRSTGWNSPRSSRSIPSRSVSPHCWMAWLTSRC
jgi:glycine betaine/choline ABC-type transport system substrate-binding protein